jgi:homoserine O-acetyltransferase/O-succinyltransferase
VAEAGTTDCKDLFQHCHDQTFLVFSIDSDLSFHPQEQARLVQLLKRARVPVMWITIPSDKGHDAFLLEPRLFAPHIDQAFDHD